MLIKPIPVVRPWQFLLLGTLLSACSGSEGSDRSGDTGGGQVGDVSGRFAGVYEVPTTPKLAAAATYPVNVVSWSSAGNDATLIYDLPKELLGKTVDLAFSGSIDAAGNATLRGEPGTATCRRDAQRVICEERLDGLKPLEPDLEVVEQLAAKTYAGAAQDRVDVARSFSNDPIGIVTIDLETLRPED